MLEAELGQVLWGSMSMGAKEDESITGAFGLLDFIMLQPAFTWHAF
jgi:hypothetical protein